MKEYTEKQHAENLIEMLEGKNPCSMFNCPLHIERRRKGLSFIEFEYSFQVCFICKSFVNLIHPIDNCPCYSFSSLQEAIKVTWLKLEEKDTWNELFKT